MSIIQLQLGNYSNFVGCHFWNMQDVSLDSSDSLKANSLFDRSILGNSRTATNINNTTTSSSSSSSSLVVNDLYLPRCIVVDYPHRFDLKCDASGIVHNSVNRRVENQRTSSSSLWSGQIDNFQQDAYESPVTEFVNRKRNDVSSGDSSIDTDYWSDFLTSRLRHSSLHSLSRVRYAPYSGQFDSFISGSTEWKNEVDAIEMKLHSLLEECDTVGGIQCLIDVDDGFSGFGNGALTLVREELPKVALLTFGIESTLVSNIDNDSAALRVACSRAMATHALRQHSTVYCPLARHNTLSFAPRFERYRSAAMLAAGISTLTSSTRLLRNARSFDSITSILDSGGAHVNIVAMRCAISNRSIITTTTTTTTIDSNSIWKSSNVLTPHLNADYNKWRRHPVAKFSVLRGHQSTSKIDDELLKQFDSTIDQSMWLPRSFPVFPDSNERSKACNIAVECSATPLLSNGLREIAQSIGANDRWLRDRCAHVSGVEDDELASVSTELLDIADYYEK